MLMWEIALIIGMILDAIFVAGFIYVIITDSGTDIGDKIGIGGGFTLIFGMPLWLGGIYFGLETGVLYWFSWCWTDFWTMEVDPIFLIETMLWGILIFIWIYIGIVLIKESLKKPRCPKCDAKIRKKCKFCYHCGRDV